MSGILWGGAAMMTVAGGQVNITGGTASEFRFTFQGGSAFAAWNFGSTGILTRKNGASWSAINQQWWTNNPESIGADYDIRATLVSGTTPSGPTLGSTTWHSLSSTREWSLTRSTVGITSCSISVSIRDATTLTVLDTATYNIEVTLEN